MIALDKSLRILLDTNIYGNIFELDEAEEFIISVGKSDFIICGCNVIRKELRKIPKEMKLRKLALSAYDLLVDFKRNYAVNELIKTLAIGYSGHHGSSFKNMENDFLIVATASIHNVEIVVSDDEKTMTSAKAIKAYQNVNRKFQLSVPKFIKFEEFKKLV